MAMVNTAPGENKKYRINVNDPFAVEKIHLAIEEKLAACNALDVESIVLLCIGTDRSTGDCLGPLVGTQLSQENQDFFYIYGTLENPVHAANLQENIENINKKHKNPFIIAIDACLGNPENIGYINICEGPLKPGAGVNKNLPPVGEIYITGIVNVGGFMEYLVLQNTRLNLVMRMAQILAKGLYKTAVELKCKKARSC